MRGVRCGWSIALITAIGITSAISGWRVALAAGDVARGKLIYEKNCQGCHGKTGVGVGGATPNLADSKRMAALTDQHLFDAVTKGRPGTGMPAWGSVLSEQDRWSVVSYLRTFPR
jgi:mono/diheme cytochrome c family protein